MNWEPIAKKLCNSIVFQNMSIDDIVAMLQCSNAQLRHLKKEEFLFYQNDIPKNMFILVEGAIEIRKDTIQGHTRLFLKVQTPGALFGETYLFLKKPYQMYAIAVKSCTVLELPGSFVMHRCAKACAYHETFSNNMLYIFANKAYDLNRKVSLLMAKSLRHKIVAYLSEHLTADGVTVRITDTREQMAADLNVTRPSLSRELSKLQQEGLILIKQNQVIMLDQEKLLSYMEE